MTLEVAVTGTAEPALAPPTSGPPPEPASALAPPEPAPALASGPASALPPPENSGAILFAARPSLIRAMNEQLLLEHIRQRGPCSRAELARVSGLSKPTVSLALASLLGAGLVREVGRSTGGKGPSAVLYELNGTALEPSIIDVPGLVPFWIDDVIDEVYPRPSSNSPAPR